MRSSSGWAERPTALGVVMIEPEALAALIQLGESDRVEFTRSTGDTDKFCKAICAFSNDLPDHGKPGYLLIGVAKDGVLTGVDVSDRLLEALASHRRNGEIIPQPSMNVDRFYLAGVAVAVIEVFPSDAPPVRYKGVTYVRTGPTVSIANNQDERRLAERRTDRARTWDARACADASTEDLAIELFELSYLPKAVAREVLAENNRSIEDKLAALRLFDPRRGQPTNAAMLLFGKDVLSCFPGAYTQYVRYDGTSAGDSVLEELRITGDGLTVLRELDLLANRLGQARPVRRPDLSDETRFAFPPVALHELFMNAFIHRNYEASTSPIAVNHFTDRIEIQNPGSLYGDLSREQFPNGTSYRNPVVAEAAKTLGFVNRFGRGIALAQAKMLENGSEQIQFEIGPNHLAAIVRSWQ